MWSMLLRLWGCKYFSEYLLSCLSFSTDTDTVIVQMIVTDFEGHELDIHEMMHDEMI